MTVKQLESKPAMSISTRKQTSSDTWKLIALAIGFVMATLDVTVVNVAAATIQIKLHLSLSGVTWIVAGYMLTFSSLLLIAGALANRYGAKRMYLMGLCTFVTASLISGASPTGQILVASRLLQGAGAALFMPSSLSLLSTAYSDEKKRAKMIGAWSAIVSIASGLGPFIGGVLVHSFGWRSIFIINVPIGIVGLILAYRVIVPTKPTHLKINLISHGLGIVGLSAFSFILIESPSYGWSSIPIITGLCITVAAAILYLLRERDSVNPVVPRELLKNPRFSATNMVGFLLNFALFGGIFMLGLFFQRAMGASPFQAGLELLPMMLMFIVGNLLFTHLTGRMGTTLPMLGGLSVAGAGSTLLTLCNPNMPYWFLAIVFSAMNLGIGITVPAMTTTLMKVAGQTHANIASATLNANRQIGALVGVSGIGLALHMSGGWHHGARITFVIMAISYLIAVALTYRFIRLTCKP